MVKVALSSGRKRGRPAKIQAKESAETLSLELDLPVVAAPTAPTIISLHLAPAKTTAVYDSYWRFAAERQRVFYRRVLGEPWPWTDNPVLETFKFKIQLAFVGCVAHLSQNLAGSCAVE